MSWSDLIGYTGESIWHIGCLLQRACDIQQSACNELFVGYFQWTVVS